MPDAHRAAARTVGALCLLGGLALFACGGGEDASLRSSCWTSVVPALPAPAPALPWQLVSEVAVPASGRSEFQTVPAGDVVYRLSTAGCVQIDSLQDERGTAWVTPPATLSDYDLFCKSCPQRVSLGVRQGLYVLPSSDPIPTAVSSLRLQATLRDCDTLLPSQSSGTVRIESAVVARPADSQRGVLRLELLITPGSIFYDSADALPPVFDSAVALINTWLAPGQLALQVLRTRRLATDDPMRLSAGDHAALERLQQTMHACDEGGTSPDDTWVPVVLAGCLSVSNRVTGRSSEPEGLTPSVPNGLPVSGGAHGVYIKGRGCDASSPQIEWTVESLARVLGHELGHYLGVYHSVELDGSPDALSDTDADNLMYARPSAIDAPHFTNHQFRIMRQHPAIAWQ